MNRVKAAVLVGGALFATPAFAQDPDPAAEGTVEAEVGAEVSTDGTTTGAEGTADVDVNAQVAAAAFWPQAAIDRPYVRPAGKLTLGADFIWASISVTEPITMTTVTASIDALGVTAAYGINDKITAGLDYAISLGLGDGDFEAAGPLTLWGGYQISHAPKLSIAATVGYSINLDNTDDMGIAAGLGAKYLITPAFAVFTGGPYGPGLVGDHLQISLAEDGPITFGIPVGAMFQATPQLNVFLSTELADISISNSDTIVFGADYIPLAVGGLFAVNSNIDVAASFGLANLKEDAFDAYAFSIGARWHN
jgi:hypothetical protein